MRSLTANNQIQQNNIAINIHPSFQHIFNGEITARCSFTHWHLPTPTAGSNITSRLSKLHHSRRHSLQKGIVLAKTSSLRQSLLQKYYSSPMRGHTGPRQTLKCLQAHFYWLTMGNDIYSFVKNCPICQTTKYNPLAPTELLQLLPIPEAAWNNITMDFIIKLPSFHSYTAIMVVVNRFKKYAHFSPLPTHFSASPQFSPRMSANFMVLHKP